MYGKVFERMYEGSMVGAGVPVFALWPYCIAKADPSDHTVELNPVLLSAILGATQQEIKEAIEYLCQPDMESHNEDHQGARLAHECGHRYLVVSHGIYQKINSNEARREYEREKKRKQRAKEGGTPEEEEAKQETNPIDWEMVQAHWNSIAEDVGLAKVTQMTDARKKKYRTRTADGAKQDEFWKVVDKECHRLKDFALGKGEEGRDWKISFDYITKSDTNFAKLEEGVFRRPAKAKAPERKRIDL